MRDYTMKYIVLLPLSGLMLTFQFLTAQPTFSKKEVSKLKVIIPDFQVNENAGPNGAYQGYASISSNSSGNFVVTWMDSRNGDGDIYAQRYASDGNPLGTNFKVNDDQGVAQMWADQWSPVISVDSRGNFVIAWTDSRNDYGDIYAQRYTGDGSALGTNFKVNDDGENRSQRNPCISTDGSGKFVIAWREVSGIYAQRYFSDGSTLGTNFKVSHDIVGSCNDPSVSIDGSGNFIISWNDDRDGDFDIYAQRYSSDGVALGNNFKVNDDVDSTTQLFTSIAIDGSGNFVITWYDHRNGDTNVYGQRFTSDGSTIGTNFKVNDIQGSAADWSPSVSSDGIGNFVVTWVDERNGDYDIYAQRYASNGSTVGTNFRVNNDQRSANQLYPSISTDGSGNFVVTWMDNRNGDPDIYAQRHASDGNPLESNFKVNDDQGSAWQRYSSISTDESGNFVVTWIDERNGDPDIYAQRFTNVGSPLGANFKVNDDQGDATQWFPSISTAGSGNFVITWADERNSNYYNHVFFDIYAQCYNSDGSPLGSNFKVNDDKGSAEHRDPSISTDSSGNFVIVWEDGRNSDYENYDIYAQRYASDGTPLGTNFKVNSDQGEYRWNPSIATNGSGNFVIAWMGDWQIYVQRYVSDGSPLGSNLKVSDEEEIAYYYPSISIESSGSYVITWEDWRNGWDNPNIYLRRYASNGSPLDSSLKVNDNIEITAQREASISTDGSGDFVIAWTDERNGNGNIYAQIYASDGSAVDSNFRVTNASNSIQSYSDVKLWNNRIYNTWTDNRAGGTGYDIWANVLEWEKNIPIIIPDNYALYQNYPNPFNPGTTIEFDLPRTSKVTLKIYNILGEEVTTIVSDELNAGSYSYEWSRPAGVASGVYLYRLEAGEYVETKKMVLIH